jgi:hypothetical protein
MVAVRKDLFALTARRAEKEDLQLASIRIKFTDHLEFEAAAFEAGYTAVIDETIAWAQFGV